MIVRDWDLSDISADLVLWGQGADPKIIRSRHPQVASVAERAVARERVHLNPVLVYREVGGKDFDPGQNLVGCSHIGQHIPACLLDVKSLVIAICTIGHALEERIVNLMEIDPVYGLAVDALGTVAVDALERAALRLFRKNAEARGLSAIGPLSPGINNWPLDKGQKAIFSLLDAQELRTVSIGLSTTYQMSPRKSTSFVLGMGPKEMGDTLGEEIPCKNCALHLTCLYRGRHHHAIL